MRKQWPGWYKSGVTCRAVPREDATLNKTQAIKENMKAFIAIVVGSSTAITSSAHAWSNKPTALIVPFPAGGVSDMTKSAGAKLD